MKIIVSTKLTNPFTKEVLKDGEKELTLGSAIGTVVGVNGFANPLRAYTIIKTLTISDTEVEFTAEDIVFIKECAQYLDRDGKTTYQPFVVGQIIDLLESVK